jgi:hypothetical protein
MVGVVAAIVRAAPRTGRTCSPIPFPRKSIGAVAARPDGLPDLLGDRGAGVTTATPGSLSAVDPGRGAGRTPPPRAGTDAASGAARTRASAATVAAAVSGTRLSATRSCGPGAATAPAARRVRPTGLTYPGGSWSFTSGERWRNSTNRHRTRVSGSAGRPESTPTRAAGPPCGRGSTQSTARGRPAIPAASRPQAWQRGRACRANCSAGR